MSTVEVKLRYGKVACPYIAVGVVDVETCWRCPRLRAFYDDDEGTNVVCAAPPKVLMRVFPRLRPRRK